VWAKILKRVPNSVLWLYKHPTMAVLRLLREARRLGVDASRLVFAGPVMPKTEHLKRLTLADVYLDTLVYNGHTTGSDVLWAGVPMVTIQVSHQLHPALPCAGSSGSDADVK
jgi:protein O-GlcNAc transferase